MIMKKTIDKVKICGKWIEIWFKESSEIEYDYSCKTYMLWNLVNSNESLIDRIYSDGFKGLELEYENEAPNHPIALTKKENDDFSVFKQHELNLNDWSAFSDVLLEAKAAAFPEKQDEIFDEGIDYSIEELQIYFNDLPNSIQMTGLEWGLSDTVFRDEAYNWYKEKLMEGNYLI